MNLPIPNPRQPAGYQYDIFISYCRFAFGGDFLKMHFIPELKNRLNKMSGAEVQLFVDDEVITTGQDWPERLQVGLAQSKTVVSLLTPGYPRSTYCMSEHESILAREAQCQHSSPLLFPLSFTNPPLVGWKMTLDLNPYFYDGPAFSQTAKFFEFQEKIRVLANALKVTIENPPVFRTDFPLLSVRAPQQPIIFPAMKTAAA